MSLAVISAAAAAANDHAAIRQSLLDGHRATALAADGRAFAIDTALAVAVGLADPHAHARAFNPHALRRRAGNRNGGQHGRGSKNEQGCAHRFTPSLVAP